MAKSRIAKGYKKIEDTVNKEIVTTPTSIRIATAGNYSGMIGAALLSLEKRGLV